MAKVEVIESVAASAKRVWDILGDFGGIRVGGPITDFSIEGSGVGAVRTITMGGARIVERLDVYDESTYTFAYSIINDDGPLPVSNYGSRVQITPNGDTACTVNWTGIFDPKGADEATASNVVRGIYTNGIARARAATAG